MTTSIDAAGRWESTREQPREIPIPKRRTGIASFDEITGGGQRSADLAYLETQIDAHGLPKKAFEWYLDLRRYGSVPHAGFGIGVERTLAWICGLEHVRETIPFPRLLNRLEP